MRGRLSAVLRILFVLGIAYPVVLLWLGVCVRHRERLPFKGPAIVVANHNSHLDVLALLSLFPLLSIPAVQPAAAADYFFRNAWLKWFSLNVIGIIPVIRGGAGHSADPLEDCYHALGAGKVLVIFPEGTRGEPEQMAELKSGIWHLAKRFPQIPIVPVFMHGLGKSMPKGALVPIPFFIDVAIGKPLHGSNDKGLFMATLRDRLQHLKLKTMPVHDNEPS